MKQLLLKMLKILLVKNLMQKWKRGEADYKANRYKVIKTADL